MAAENIVLKSLATVERAFHTPSAQERFKQMFDAIIAKAGEEKGLQILKEIVSVADNDGTATRKLKLKLTYTTHPTIMHNIQTILHRNGITGAAEDLIGGIKSGTYNTDSLIGKIDAFAKQAADPSFDLTHMKTISLEEEDALEYQNHDILTKQDTLAINAWNEAFSADPRLQNQGLEIDQSIIERRTWGRRADKDGRGKSNSLGLYSNIVKCIENGAFKDPKFDTRDNKRQNEDLVSALIQVAARKSLGLKPYPVSTDGGKFAQYCEDFVAEVNTKESAKTWRNPKDSIYQELGEHKAEFARRLILSDFKLVPSSIVAHTVPFAAFYTNAFNKFVEEYQKKAAATGLKKLPDNPTFDDLEAIPATEVGFQNLQAQFRQHIHNTPVEFEYEGKKVVWRFRISETGLHYRQDDYYGENEFFKKRKTVTTDPESGKITGQIPFSELERDNLMDILRRMEVLKHFANELGDNVVADRHEIANFSSASNFYDVMLLFKETGLLEIEGEEVTRSSIGIVTLLETIEDLENAEAIFEQLLNDDLVRNYYRARGNVAEIMCGFSDGAKSAGNIASEWNIS
jgi:hypothetical protein